MPQALASSRLRRSFIYNVNFIYHVHHTCRRLLLPLDSVGALTTPAAECAGAPHQPSTNLPRTFDHPSTNPPPTFHDPYTNLPPTFDQPSCHRVRSAGAPSTRRTPPRACCRPCSRCTTSSPSCSPLRTSSAFGSRGSACTLPRYFLHTSYTLRIPSYTRPIHYLHTPYTRFPTHFLP